MHKLLFCGLLLLSVPGYSQLVSLGVKAGVPLTDPLDSSRSGFAGTSHSVKRYIVGVTGELHLPLGLSVEVDALYRRLSYDFFATTLPVPPAQPQAISTSNTGGDWQFPILAKYHFRRRPFVSPFLDAGVTYRHVTLSVQNPNSAGVTVGGGITFKLLFLRLSPEIRYTHFPTELFGPNSNFIQSTSNQVDFLVGFTF